MQSSVFKETEIGMIPEDWELLKVGTIGKVITGKTPPTKEKSFYGLDFMFVKIPDMGSTVYVRRTNSMLSKKGAEYMKRLRLPKESIMISCIATIGNVTIASEDCFTNQQINSIIPNEKVTPKWVYYFFKNNKDYLASRGGGGSVYTNISKSKFEDLSIAVPQINEQTAISKILFDLDAKIELLQQQNKTLENIGKAIFKQWFVDFEFPDEQGNPYKSSGGEMVESKLGEIPKGWDKLSLIDIVKHLKPGTNYQPKRVESGIPFINVRNIQNGFLTLTNVKYITKDEYNRVHKMWEPEENDLLITRIGTLGNVGVIRKKDLPVAVHYNSISIKVKNTSFQFLYFLFISDFFQKQYHFRKKQSVQEYVTIDEVEKIKIFLPKENLVFDRLQNSFNILFDKIKINSDNIENLIIIRDSLLPKLMTGKIRVNI
ncbi:MAG: restriction endonuclease subunit S [Candidatus Woesearchaeota archaeon]|nr:MAG: restriction endonuclease subunit S [Candidatus Woesearchaeota archaeon]